MPPTEKIRVLIVDDIAETRDKIRRMLEFDPQIEVAGMAQSGKEAISLSAQIKPDVVVMDINLPDIDGITTTEMIRKNAPHIQVVILSVQSDPSYMRRAMLAGARDFLSKPPMIDELTSAIRRAGTMAHDEKAKSATSVFVQTSPGGVPVAVPAKLASSSGKIIVVYSPKGGVGCTTIATNLAVALKSKDPRVALVDASMQYGDLPVFLNEQIKNSVLDLAPRVDELDTEVVESVMINHPATGLSILAGPPKPEQGDHIDAEEFSKLLEYMRTMFSYIIIDTSTYLTKSVQAALDISDLIILVTTQDIPSIKNCNLFLGLADASGIKRKRILFVMNRFDKRISISPERVGESLRQEITLTIPLEEKAISNSIIRGIPFVHENKTLPISKVFFTLADSAASQLEKLDEPLVEKAGRK